EALAESLAPSDSRPGPRVLKLPGGRLLVAPECRQPPAAVSRLTYDRLAVAAEGVAWLKAYAQYFGNNIHVDPAFLAAEAARRIADGGHGIALRLIGRAASAAPGLAERGVLQLQAQGWRIATQRYREAGEAPDPSAALPEAISGPMRLLKGWG